MAEEKPKGQDRPNEQPKKLGGITLICSVAFSLIGTVLGCMIAAVIIEWVGIFIGWWPPNHSTEVLTKLLTHLHADKVEGNYLFNPALIIAHSISAFERWFGFDLIKIMAHELTAQTNPLQLLIVSALNITYVVIIKVSYFIVTMPLVILIAIPFLFDGYIYRQVRKYTGIRDSDLKFTIATKLTGFNLIGISLVYFALPFEAHPAWFLTPIFILSAYGMRLMLINLAKYM